MAPCKDKSNSIGNLAFRVTLQELTQTTDSQGGFTEAWTQVGEMWASIRPMKGYEKFQTGQLDTPGLSKVRIRYRAGVTTKHRFLFGTRVLTIKEVINVDEQDDWLDITTIEKQ